MQHNAAFCSTMQHNATSAMLRDELTTQHRAQHNAAQRKKWCFYAASDAA
jgi:hypothetical protein